jgi:hypothetical protein
VGSLASTYILKSLEGELSISFINYSSHVAPCPSGMKKGLNAAKFDRCVSKVKSKSGKKANPYAVCNSTMSGKSKGKSKNSRKTGK